MKYAKEQMNTEMREKPQDGWHVMRIAKEFPNTKSKALHTFVLEDKSTGIFWNVFLRELPLVGKAIGVSQNDLGEIDTDHFINKNIHVLVGDKFSKDGKVYKTILEYGPAGSLPDESDDIPF